MKHYPKLALFALLLSSGIAFVSCSDDDDATPPPAELTIYQKLGGTTMVSDPNNPGQMIEQGRLSYRSVVDSTIVLIVTDIGAGAEGNLGEYFAPIVGEVTNGNTTNVAVLSKSLTDFFSANTGGGATNTYTGLGMVAAHDPAQNPRMGAKADNGDYDQFVGYVVEAALLNGLDPVNDAELLGEIGAVLESLRTPIVQDL